MATPSEYLPAVRVMLVSEATRVEAKWAANPQECIAIGRELIGDADREHVLALLVDVHLRVVAIHTVAIGGLAQAPCDVAATFRAAILANAAGIVLVHNHPSGSAVFSDDDRRLWATIQEAGRLLGIGTHDFLVVTPGGGPAASLVHASEVGAERTRKTPAVEAEERAARRRIRCRTEDERTAFVSAIERGAGPGDFMWQERAGGPFLTFRGLARRFCSAGLALPERSTLALGLPKGASYASAARCLLRRWEGEGSGDELRDRGVAQIRRGPGAH